MAPPTKTLLGWTVKANWVAGAGSTVTLAVWVMVTAPTVAVTVLSCATVELRVPVMCPAASVVPDGVSVLPVPVAVSDTGTPATALPNASSTVTVIVEALDPVLAVIGVGAAVTEDRGALGPAAAFTM
jgi:hypothetical protein